MLKIYIQFGSRSPTGSKNILTIKKKKNIMEAKFYKWIAPFSEEDTIDQVLMVHQWISCKVNDFGENQKIEYFDYEADTTDMTPATKEEFVGVYSKVNGEMLSRILNTIL